MKKIAKGLHLRRETVLKLQENRLQAAEGGSQLNDTVYHGPVQSGRCVVQV
jgi:hypothetical protein